MGIDEMTYYGYNPKKWLIFSQLTKLRYNQLFFWVVSIICHFINFTLRFHCSGPLFFSKNIVQFLNYFPTKSLSFLIIFQQYRSVFELFSINIAQFFIRLIWGSKLHFILTEVHLDFHPLRCECWEQTEVCAQIIESHAHRLSPAMASIEPLADTLTVEPPTVR